MAEDNITLGALEIPVLMDLAPLGRQGPAVARTAEAMGDRASQAFRQHFGQAAGRKAAREFTDAMERQFLVARADIAEALARGLITPQEAEKRGREAGARYRDAILAEIKKRSASGTLTDRDFVDLTGRLERIGEQGGEQFNEGVLSRMQRLPGLMRGIIYSGVVAVVVEGMRRASRAVADFGRLAGETNQIGRGFSSLTAQRGLDPANVLRELRQATNHAVEGTELMRRSNLLLNSELPLTASNVGELAYLSRRLAESMGRDAAEGFDRFSRGIVKMETELLDELGIMVRVDVATRRWAEANGRTVQSLTDAERQLALYNAVVDQAREKVAALGDEQVDAGTRVQQAAAYWDDLKRAVTLAVAESPRVSAFFDAIGVGASGAADRVQELADRWGAFLDSGSGFWSMVGGGGGMLAGALLGVGTGGIGAIPGALIGGSLGTLAGSSLGQFGGPSYDEALASRQGSRAHENALREIRAQTDLQALERQRAALLQELGDLQRENASDYEAQRRVAEKLAAVEQAMLRRRTAPAPTSPTETLTRAEQARIDAARAALEQRVREFRTLESHGVPALDEQARELPALLQQVIRLDREIAQIEKEIADARGRAPEGAQALLAAYQAQRDAAASAARAIADGAQENLGRLDELRARVVRVVDVTRGMASAAVDLGEGGWRTLSGAMDGVARATQEAQAAQEALIRAQLSGDPDRLAGAIKRQEAAQKAAGAAAAQAMRVFEAGADQGIVSQARLNELIAEMIELLREAGVETKDLVETRRDWGEIARTVEGLARGVLSVADAMGTLDGETRRTLQGVVDLASGISGIFSSGGANIGAWAQGIGGLVGLITGLAGDSAEERRKALEAHARQMNATYRLVRALDELRASVLSDISVQERDRMVGAGASFEERFGSWFDAVLRSPNNTGRVRLDGLTQEEFDYLSRLEEWAGFEFFDQDTMFLWIEGFREAAKEFSETPVGGFGEDLEGRLDAFDFAMQMAGDAIGGASEQMELFLRTLRGIPEAAGFAAEFGRILAEEGEEAAREWLQEQAIRYAEGGADALAWAEGLTGAEIERVLQSGTSALDRLAEAADKTASSLSNVPELFDHALRRRQAVYEAGGSPDPAPRTPAPRPEGPRVQPGTGSAPVQPRAPRALPSAALAAPPADLGGFVPANLRAELEAARISPWEPSHIQALLQRSDPAPIVERLDMVRAALERRRGAENVTFNISVPKEAVPARGWNERELANEVRRITIDLLHRDAEVQVEARWAVGQR